MNSSNIIKIICVLVTYLVVIHHNQYSLYCNGLEVREVYFMGIGCSGDPIDIYSTSSTDGAGRISNVTNGELSIWDQGPGLSLNTRATQVTVKTDQCVEMSTSSVFVHVYNDKSELPKRVESYCYDILALSDTSCSSLQIHSYQNHSCVALDFISTSTQRQSYQYRVCNATHSTKYLCNTDQCNPENCTVEFTHAISNLNNPSISSKYIDISNVTNNNNNKFNTLNCSDAIQSISLSQVQQQLSKAKNNSNNNNGDGKSIGSILLYTTTNYILIILLLITISYLNRF